MNVMYEGESIRMKAKEVEENEISCLPSLGIQLNKTSADDQGRTGEAEAGRDVWEVSGGNRSTKAMEG